MNDELKALVTKLYLEHETTVHPMFPKVLVRLLPREHKTKAGLWVPDGAQNKPVHEGIVLETYKPFWRSIWKLTDIDSYKVITSHTLLDEQDRIQAIWQECAVKAGDHIIFPYMALGITPVWPLDDGRGDYRLVPEGEIYGTLNYEKKPTKDWLSDLLIETGNVGFTGDVATAILAKADVVRKDLPSLTTSGK